MINGNRFFVKQLKTIVFIGYSPLFKELININKKYNINSFVITSIDQSKLLDVDFYIFDSITDELFSFLKNKGDIKEILLISIGSRLIFNKKIINFLEGNLINFHGSRLPFDSGGGGFSWRIMRGDRIDNQLVHIVDEGIDTGHIIDSESSIFPSWCKNPQEHQNYSQQRFLIFYENFISKVKDGKYFDLRIQDKSIGNYYPRLNTEINGLIDWSLSSNDLYNFINSFDEPYIGASTFLNNNLKEKVYIKSIQIHGGEFPNHPFMKGLVTRNQKKWIIVATSDKNSLIIEKVIDVNGKNIVDKIRPGDRFNTPQKYLENSFTERVKYTTKGKT